MKKRHKIINIHEAKTHLSAILSALEVNNEPVVICRSGRPIARILPYKKVKRSKLSSRLRIKLGDLNLTRPISSDWDV